MTNWHWITYLGVHPYISLFLHPSEFMRFPPLTLASLLSLSLDVFVHLLFRQPYCEIIMSEMSLSFLGDTILQYIFFWSTDNYNLSAPILQCSLSLRYRNYIVMYPLVLGSPFSVVLIL